MNNIYDKIINMTHDDNYYYIECEKNKLRIKIIDGELNIVIKNTENNYIPFYELSVNDIINIYYNNINKYIEPKLIIINTKYDFYDNSDDEII